MIFLNLFNNSRRGMDVFNRYEVFYEIKASQIRKEYRIEPKEGEKYSLLISNKNGRTQKIAIEFKLSSLGKGWVAYLVCPVSSKRCRVLYLIQGIYQRNLNLKGFYMRSNPLKYHQKDLYKLCQAVQAKTEIEEMVNKPYFKPYYKGKLTKMYAAKLRLAEKAGNKTMFSIINGIP
jgi:hypothetical protein